MNLIEVGRGEETIQLGSLLAGRPSLLVMLRHSGCPLCREHLVVTEGLLDDLVASGCQVIGICQNNAEEALALEQELALRFPVYGDPSMALYRALSMPRGSWWQVTLGPILRQPFKALRRMGQVKKPGKDVRQLGGVVLISTAGEILFRYQQKDSGDLPGDDLLLAAVREKLSLG